MKKALATKTDGGKPQKSITIEGKPEGMKFDNVKITNTEPPKETNGLIDQATIRSLLGQYRHRGETLRQRRAAIAQELAEQLQQHDIAIQRNDGAIEGLSGLLTPVSAPDSRTPIVR